MHPLSCTCPDCRAGAAQEFEYEYESFESGEMLSEQEELELAMELLSVQHDQELEQFLGNLVRRVGQGLKSAGKFVSKNVLPIVGPALKQLAKAALPLAGSALGSLIPIPGVGTALGGALGRAAANALETELAGMAPEQADIEKARRFVRIAESAIRQASVALGTVAPEVAVRSALTAATRRHIPGIDLSRIQPGLAARTAPGPASASGRWWIRGNTLVIDGV